MFDRCGLTMIVLCQAIESVNIPEKNAEKKDDGGEYEYHRLAG
jgi:hypothetical protein